MERGYFSRGFLKAIMLVFGALLFVLPWFAHAETINFFNAHFSIEKSGDMRVTERIIYDFGADQKHGIYRTIPLTANNGPTITVSNIAVADELGNPYLFTLSESGNAETIRIGDPNTTVTGQKTYVINYVVRNVIRGFTDHEELYWNVTGNEWQVPIGHAEAIVNLPDASATNVQMKCFTGRQGATNFACTAVRENGVVTFATTESLGRGEGLTIVVGMPLGSVTVIATTTGAIDTTSMPREGRPPIPFGSFFNIIPVLLAIFVSIRLARVFSPSRSRGRAPRPVIPKELKHDPLIAEYEAPDRLSPIEVGTIMDRQVDPTDISSVIIHLAVRKYLKIRYLKSKVMFFTVKDFELVKLKNGDDLITPADKQIFAMLFSGRDSVTVGVLKQEALSVRKSVKTIQKETLARIEDEGYFNKEARESAKKALKKKTAVFSGGFILFYFFLTFFSPNNSELSAIISSFFFAFLLAVAVVITRLARSADRTLTQKGVDAMRKILGFKEFLKVTETDRLKMLDAPVAEPELFEKNLPYAMVFGVEKEWAKQFEGIYTSVPDWYEDDSMRGFNAPVFVSQLVLFNTAVNGSFGAYSGSGPYSSGFSGGFSGGGSGGGGGGSW